MKRTKIVASLKIEKFSLNQVGVVEKDSQEDRSLPSIAAIAPLTNLITMRSENLNKIARFVL